MLRPDENAGGGAFARAVEQPRDVLLGFEFVEKLAHAVEIADRILVEQIGLPAHEQHRAVGAVGRPDREAARHQILSGRSEEHTSELQTLMRISYAVFCLKKKTMRQQSQRKQLTV